MLRDNVYVAHLSLVFPSQSLEEGWDGTGAAPECSLRLEMLPGHIPLSVAEKVLFIGEYILVFERGASRDSGRNCRDSLVIRLT